MRSVRYSLSGLHRFELVAKEWAQRNEKNERDESSLA